MKCSDCKVEMEKGTLTNTGNVWTSKNVYGLGFMKTLTGGKIVLAYHCPNCKKINLVTE